ncbi:uncharacterized protein LDX57_002863 [Aspergillus melleus]|uniref:uncharacterized protein n=1 Tax=Aspergillus melleus TaxID=138277 RepID=UPI001E8DAF4F|nr:uncharacterized protein LDX57_002863 [Aspergillus melleus]KAH8425114.1 hypothetical protein LDX57_002863 [Aspergillus melleus]
MAQVFGRAEMFILSIFASVLGYVIYAACQDIPQYIAAGIFEAIGSTGYALTQQVFVADVTNLINRGIWSTLPDSLTTVPTLYLGTIVAQRILDHSTWRWGWGINAWHKGSFIAMVVLGVVLLIAFLVWDAWFAKKPFVPYRMINNRTVAAACVLGALDFFHYSVFSVFFTSYLQVAGHFSAGHATRIDNSLRVAFQVSGIFVAFFMKYTKRSQIWVFTGVPLCVLGMGVLLYLVDMGNGRTGNEAAFVTAKALIGIGRGFYQTASQVSVQAVVTRQEVSVVTAVFFASMSVGGAVGTSVAGAIWRSTLPSKLQEYLPDDAKSQAKAIFGSIKVAQKYAIGSPIRKAVDRSYRESQRLLGIAGLAALVPMLIVMFFLRNVKLDERLGAKEGEDEGQTQGGERDGL